MYRILLVEDSLDTQLIIKRTIERNEIQVILAGTLREGRQELKSHPINPFHLIILDIGLPDGDGITVLDELQSNPNFRHIPVILLTGRDEISLKVAAFSMGAEDYLVKPINPIELKARVDMRLRKLLIKEAESDILRKGALTIRTSLMRVSVNLAKNEQILDLTAKEFKILAYLARNEGRPFSRGELKKMVWGESVHVLDRTVDSHICGLRRKLREIGEYIESVPGVGYRFQVPSENTPYEIGQTLATYALRD